MNEYQQHQLDLMKLEQLQDDLEKISFNKIMESRRSDREIKEIKLEIEYYKDIINAFHKL